MSDNFNNPKYYDDFAANYDAPRHRGYHAMLDRIELDAILPLAAGKDVLEIGCGTGLLLKEVTKVAASAQGIDSSEGMLSRARARGLRVQEADALTLPFEDASFDFVYSCKVLPHISQLDDAIAEAVRVTKPGGMLALEFYNRHSLRHLVKRATGPGRIGAGHKESDIHTYWESPEEIAKRLPKDVVQVRVHGVRIVTPLAQALKVPIFGSLLARAERMLASTPFARFGGFYLVVLQKR